MSLIYAYNRSTCLCDNFASSIPKLLGVTNLYDRNNIFYYDRVRAVRVDQLPIMPNLGFNWKF